MATKVKPLTADTASVGMAVQQHAVDESRGAVNQRSGAHGTIVKLGRTRAVVEFGGWTGTYRVGYEYLKEAEGDPPAVAPKPKANPRRNLAKARRVRIEKAEQIRKQRAREHKAAKREYDKQRDKYRRVVQQHGDQSPQEKKAFHKLIRSEAEWFRTYPKAA